MKRFFFLFLVFHFLCLAEAGARRSRRARHSIQNGPTQYVFFEMQKFEKREPYFRSIKYPHFKGTGEFKAENLNKYLEEKFESSWKCEKHSETSKIVVSSKMLLFNPKLSSLKLSIEKECDNEPKLNSVQVINFSLASGQIFTQSDFLDQGRELEFKKIYLEKLNEDIDDSCSAFLKEKANGSNFNFFISKDQVSVSLDEFDVREDCDIYADFSYSEILNFKSINSPLLVIKR